MYSESCLAVKKTISKSKSVILQKKISDCNGDQKKLFKIVDTLLRRNKEATLPKYDSPLTMAPSNGGLIYCFMGMRTRWMAGAAAQKSG